MHGDVVDSFQCIVLRGEWTPFDASFTGSREGLLSDSSECGVQCSDLYIFVRARFLRDRPLPLLRSRSGFSGFGKVELGIISVLRLQSEPWMWAFSRLDVSTLRACCLPSSLGGFGLVSGDWVFWSSLVLSLFSSSSPSRGTLSPLFCNSLTVLCCQVESVRPLWLRFWPAIRSCGAYTLPCIRTDSHNGPNWDVSSPLALMELGGLHFHAHEANETPNVVSSVCSWIQEQLHSFVLSALLFYLLAVLHLVVHVCPLHRGHRRRNQVKRKARYIFRGAPIIWAFFAVAHILPVALAAPKSSGASSGAFSSADSDQGFGGCGLHAPAADVASGLTERTAFDTSSFIPRVGNPSSGRGSGTFADFKFLIQVYEFQTPVSSTALWTSEATCEQELLTEFSADYLSEAKSKVVIAVSPQPRTPGLALIVADTWNLSRLCVPVLLQCYVKGHSAFVEFFIGRVSYEDIRSAVGDLWPPGAHIYVGHATTPMLDDDIISPTPGLLIRIVPPSVIPGSVCTVGQRLEDPLLWLSREEVHTDLAAQDGSGKICVLGQRADQMIVPVNRSTTAARLRGMIMEQCGLLSPDTAFCAPTRQLWNFATRGAAVRTTVGLIPSALASCKGVFVDARRLACRVQLVLLPPVTTNLRQLLHLVGAERPEGFQLRLEGADGYNPVNETFFPQHGSLLTVVVVSPFDDGVDARIEGTSSDTDADGPEEEAEVAPSLPNVRLSLTTDSTVIAGGFASVHSSTASADSGRGGSLGRFPDDQTLMLVLGSLKQWLDPVRQQPCRLLRSPVQIRNQRCVESCAALLDFRARLFSTQFGHSMEKPLGTLLSVQALFSIRALASLISSVLILSQSLPCFRFSCLQSGGLLLTLFPLLLRQ